MCRPVWHNSDAGLTIYLRALISDIREIWQAICRLCTFWPKCANAWSANALHRSAHCACRLKFTPPDVMAQALGVNASDVPPSLAARNSNAGFLTRMAAPPNSTLDAYRATSLLQPPQNAVQVHRFPLAHGSTPQARFLNTPKPTLAHHAQQGYLRYTAQKIPRAC